VNPGFPTDTEEGDVDAALAAADVVVDATYETPAFHNNPMEAHATTAVWEDGELVLYDSNQGVQPVRTALAQAFGLHPEHVRVISEHVGGGFGSKGTPRPHVVLAAMAARVVERPVTVAVTRQQMFAFVGYRTPTIQRLRLGARRSGALTALSHEVVEQTSTVVEFAEQTAVPSRMMYAAQARRTRHRLAALDVPTPSWMRAPGECPGMYALESAMDELAIACGIDPVELRVLNEPETDPETGNRSRAAASSRACTAGRSGSDGPAGTRRNERVARAAGSSAPALRRRPIPRAGARRRLPPAWRPTAPTRSFSAPRTSAPARARC
jgi:xanthine dehydrogenase YagR molybdenum-binding subunit